MTTNSPGIWVTTVVQYDTDIHDIGEWWDLRWTISMRRLGPEPGTRNSFLCYIRTSTPVVMFFIAHIQQKKGRKKK